MVGIQGLEWEDGGLPGVTPRTSRRQEKRERLGHTDLLGGASGND